MEIKAIIGLGNPEPEYEDTFHNAGRMFVLFLADGSDFKQEKSFRHAENNRTRLILSDLNMNQSGLAVKEAAKKFKLQPEEIAVAQDDSDIALGEYKLSFGRNSAGHKGIESVIQALGTKDFYRLRFGIREVRDDASPSRPSQAKAGEFVLRKIGKKESELLKSAFYGAKVNVIEKLNPLGVV